MGTKLTTNEARTKANCCEIVDQYIGGFMQVGRALTQLCEEELYVDEADSFREFLKKRWPQHLSYAYRQISSFEAACDVSGVLVSPIGDKDKTSLPKNEAIAREISKVESAEHRADLWTAVHNGRKANDVTASMVAKKRRELFPETMPGSSNDVSVAHGATPAAAPASEQFTAKHDFSMELDAASDLFRRLADQDQEAVLLRLAVLRLEFEGG